MAWGGERGGEELCWFDLGVDAPKLAIALQSFFEVEGPMDGAVSPPEALMQPQ